MRLGILSTHPIQYQAPLFRELARVMDVQVYFAHQASADDQAKAGFGVAFEWDVPLLEGYSFQFLQNKSDHPGDFTFGGYDTPEIGAIIRKERFDAFLVNGWYNRSYWQAILASWASRTPLMVRGDSHLETPRSIRVKLAKHLVYRSFIPRFDAYLCVGSRAREYYLHYGAKKDRMFFTPHFIDNQYFQEASGQLRPRRQALRSRYHIPPDARVALFSGKFIREKRPLDFVRAVKMVSDQDSSVVGLMVGDGPLRPEIETCIRTTGSPVVLAGFVNQSTLPEMYAISDVLLLPSESETWGLVVNEAMASGLPVVVSSAVGCHPDLVDTADVGGVHPVGDLEAMEIEIRRVLAMFDRPEVAVQLNLKMNRYSVQSAVQGVVDAMERVRRTR